MSVIIITDQSRANTQLSLSTNHDTARPSQAKSAIVIILSGWHMYSLSGLSNHGAYSYQHGSVVVWYWVPIISLKDRYKIPCIRLKLYS